MSKRVKEAAERLRKQACGLSEVVGSLYLEANKLEKIENVAPTAMDLIAKHTSPSSRIQAEVVVDLNPLGSKHYDARRHMCRQAANEIAHHIAATLDFNYGRTGMELLRSDLYFARDCETYRATVIAMTPPERQKLVEEAIRAGAGL